MPPEHIAPVATWSNDYPRIALRALFSLLTVIYNILFINQQ